MDRGEGLARLCERGHRRRLVAALRGEAYGEVFDVASSLIGVKALGAPDLMIEIKCTARL